MAGADGASSISVAVRVRPFTIREAAQLTRPDDGPLFLGDGSLAAGPLPKFSQKGLRSVIKVVDERCLIFDPPENNPVQRFSRSVVPQGIRNKDQTFGFDKVFDENITQGDVYEATTKSLLDSVLDGYNATVFAYGATGCGKTHTITGTVQQPGIIFLTMQELFERIAELQAEKTTEVSLSYLEIYNETIRDLLVAGGAKSGLMLREDANQAVSVSGLSSHHPQNVAEVMDMIVRGNECRTMSPTEANATSSRSHAVLQINVSQKDRNADIHEPHTMATLSIIDLAGSERASATKNRGERLTEGANINKSLLALGSCINALCDPRKTNHVPYRNSKLTRLLKFSLGGNCKTVMIVCVSPSSAHFDETQNTLRYANRAKNIQTKVTRNVFNVNRHVKDFLKKIDEQMAMINELKAQQKDYESVAFGKFRKQADKKDSVLREGLARLKSAFEHSQSERQEHLSSVKKLRQIEMRITMLSSWTTALDHAYTTLDPGELPDNIRTLRKTAQGILVELEQSRSHYHQRLAKADWHRAIEAALTTGMNQLESSGAELEQRDVETLHREAELMKARGDRELHTAIMALDKTTENAVLQSLLKSSFETIVTVTELVALATEDGSAKSRSSLMNILQNCTDTVQQVVRPDGAVAVLEPLGPTKAGTPKRRKIGNISGVPTSFGPSMQLPVPSHARFSMSPTRSSPRRRAIFVSPKKGPSVTPRKKSPAKRAVRWRDDTADGTLAEWSQTPQRTDEPTTTQSSDDSGELPSRPKLHSDFGTEADSSSPIPAPPETRVDSDKKFKAGRFQAGFLSRKVGSGSPPGYAMNHSSSSPPEPSPLREMNINKAASRSSGELMPPPSLDRFAAGFSSESADEEAKEVGKAIRRASLSRADHQTRVHRRRSPTSSSTGGSSPPNENALFTASHARRMVKSEKDNSFKQSVLSPKATPIAKPDPGSARRMTLSDDRAVQRSASRGGRMSSAVSSVGSRPSLTEGKNKSVWR